jgi:hypothetical protein
MKDLSNMKVIYFKGVLFLVMGVLCSVLLIIECPTIKTGFLLGAAVWSFARLYYFAFYVIEHYVDSSYKFSGIWSFVRYLCRKDKSAFKK